jgi:flagellar biogenesis protein FliO
MTPLRQASSTAALLFGLSFALPTLAEPLAPMGPPTAAEAAQAAVAPAPVVPPVALPPAASAAPVNPAPSWLASRPAPKAPVAGKSALPSSGRLAGMLLVLGVLGGAAVYLKRRGKVDRKVDAIKERLLVVSSTRIGPKAHAVVIAVHGRQMLLGVTDSSVKRLAFLDEVEDEVEERETRRGARAPGASRGASIAVRAVTPDPARGRSFAELLKTAFKKPEPPAEASAAAILASETRDVIVSKPVGAAAPAPVRMLDVEGQAQGLLRRLGGPRV